jgi:hypothetical protein
MYVGTSKLLGSITGRITAESHSVAWQVTGLVAENLLPMSSRQVTKLWASHFWECCSGSKLLGDGVLRQVTTRQVDGRVAPDLKPPSEKKWSARKIIGEGEEYRGKSLGGSLPESSRSVVTKLLRTSNVFTARERGKSLFPGQIMMYTDSYTVCSIVCYSLVSARPFYNIMLYEQGF